jgi:peptidoglycan-associated lipoprotein
MRYSLLVSLGTAALVGAACGGQKPAPEPAPVPVVVDSTRIKDSILQAQSAAHDQALRDSITQAAAAAEAARQRHIADSVAAVNRTTGELKSMLATMVHYDVDKSDVRRTDQPILDQKVAILQANPALTIAIVGHADERGPDEYNLALGNRRALAVKKYLTDHGIPAARITTSSRGEEQPLDPAHNEAAWATNRRGEFAITAGGDVLLRPSGM